MSNNDIIGNWVRRFLMEYLIGERNLSQNTQASHYYRDTPERKLEQKTKAYGFFERLEGYLEELHLCCIRE